MPEARGPEHKADDNPAGSVLGVGSVVPTPASPETQFRLAARTFPLTASGSDDLTLASALREQLGYEPGQVIEQLWFMERMRAAEYLSELLSRMSVDGEPCPDPAFLADHILTVCGRPFETVAHAEGTQDVIPVDTGRDTHGEDRAALSYAKKYSFGLQFTFSFMTLLTLLASFGAPIDLATGFFSAALSYIWVRCGRGNF